MESLTPRSCSEKGCTRKHNARGLCLLHYKRMRKHGSAITTLRDRGVLALERLMKRMTPNGDCWDVVTRDTVNGYSRLTIANRKTLAHRVAYTEMVGPIPDGGWVLHRCDNRRCCNPAHLYIGDRAQNMRDMWSRNRRG